MKRTGSIIRWVGDRMRVLKRWFAANARTAVFTAVLVAVAAFAFFLGYFSGREKGKSDSIETLAQRQRQASDAPEVTEKPESAQGPAQTAMPEEDIYTFLQGPKSWRKRLVWSGEWGEKFYDGGSFGGFGCGLCCIANLYSSLTDYQCTPVDAYRYAKRKTDYSGGGAIDWGYMRQSLSSLGFDCGVRRKPQSYEAFREEIKECRGAVALVCSADSSCYWRDTPGHYVTVFLYDEKRDKVFLADSGDPEHNRQWVALRKIYKSLKTASSWQYLVVGGYDKEKDEWHHKKAEGNWVRQ